MYERRQEEETMSDAIRCTNCGKTWIEDELHAIHDYWGRVEPGGVVPLGQCPNGNCRALCYPAHGYVYDLEHQVTALRHVLTALLEWAAAMGGWEAPVWEQARRLLTPSERKDSESYGRGHPRAGGMP